MSPKLTKARVNTMKTCPHCGKVLPSSSKRQTKPSAPISTDGLSDAELYKHYHTTAPVEDLRFFVTHAMLSDDLRAQATALLETALTDGKLPCTRTEWYRRLASFHQQWRHDKGLLELGERWAAEIDVRRARRLAFTSAMMVNEQIRARLEILETRIREVAA